METSALIGLLFAFLLIIVIACMLVKLYFMIRDQGIQISVLLKREKEGYVPAQRWNMREAWSNAGPNLLMPSDKQYKTNNNLLLSTSSRTWEPSHILPSDKLTRVKSNESGINGIVQTAKEVGASVEDTLVSGAGALAQANVKRENIPFREDLPAIDQRGVIENPVSSFSERQSPSFLNSVSEGFKVRNENSKSRFRATHKAGHTY